MVAEISRTGIAETTLVFGLAGSIVYLLIEAGQPLGIAWVEVVGSSRVVALALLTSFCAWLLSGLAYGRYVMGAALLFSIAISWIVPVEYWSIMLFGYGGWSAIRRSVAAPTLIALSALGLHIALVGDRLPEVLSFALHMDTVFTATLIELSGRTVDVQGTVLIVEEGISLRLIGPCSSIWPMLIMIGAIGSALGAVRLGSMPRAYVIMVLGSLASMSFNGLRLATMSTSNAAYDWLHSGTGAAIFRILLLATIVVAFAIVALRRNPTG